MDKLFIDIGNTAVKWQLNQQSVVLELNFQTHHLPKIRPKSLILVSIVAQHQQLDVIKKHYPNQQFFIAKTQKQYKNLINAYEQVNNLGVDRWLNLIASYEKFPHKNCLVISFGTATTIDVLTQTGAHKGGLILPCLDLLKQGFKQFNQSKELVKLAPKIILSNQTEKAWQLGCESLWFHGIYQIIHQLYIKHKIDSLVITGGYAPLIMNQLDLEYYYNEVLLFSGLEFLWKNTKNES